MKFNQPWLLVVLILLSVTSAFVAIAIMDNWFIKLPYIIQFKIHGSTEENALAICSGKDLKDTCYCLNVFVSSIYKYTITDDKATLSFDELKTLGGDCKDWGELTCRLGKKLGFDCTKNVIPVREEENVIYRHTWTTLSNSGGYCELDENNLNFFPYKNG